VKNSFRLLGIALVVAIACAFAACKDIMGPEEQQSERGSRAVVVTFNLNGGQIEGVTGTYRLNVDKGDWLPPLQTPSIELEDYEELEPGLYEMADGKISITFDNWYLSPTGTEPWDRAPVTEDITLYARYKSAAPVGTFPVNDIIPAAVTYINSNPGRYLILLDSDLIPGTEKKIPLGAAVSLSSGAHLVIDCKRDSEIQIQRSANNSGLTVNLDKDNSSLTIGKNVTLMGRNPNNNSVVRITGNNAEFIMEAGSKITGNTLTGNAAPAPYGASAVYITGGGIFTMNGGKIESNTSNVGYTNSTVLLAGPGTAAGSPGGDGKVPGGKFIMNGGSIIYNSHQSAGWNYTGTVNVQLGTFIMNNGSIFENSRLSTLAANPFHAGGVCVADKSGAKFEMYGGMIYNNTSTGTGSYKHDVFVHSTGTSEDATATASGTGKIILGGMAYIKVLTLNAVSASVHSYIRVASALKANPTVTTLNLRGNNNNAATVAGYWTGSGNQGIVRGDNYTLVPEDLGKFTLGQFLGQANSPATQAISPRILTLNASGNGILQ